MKLNLLVIIFSFFVFGCSSEKASFETQEKSRKTAIENAEYNAKQFRTKNPLYQQFGLITDGDSTISPSCPQGDGWATLELVNNDNQKQRVKIKCSTVSDTIGCLEATKFKTKTYASEDGVCNKNIPFPLPKIVK